MDYQMTVLPNGIKVASVFMPHAGSVTMGFWVRNGSRYEPARLCGVSHFIEHLLFKGTRTRSAREISEAVEGLGGYFNAFTQEESTCYYAKVADQHAWRVFDVLVDMYRNSKFSAKDIERERGVIMEEIMMYRDRPQVVAEEKLQELLWADHPLGRPILGPPEVIKRITREQLMDYWKTRYVPRSLALVFAGNVEHEDCVKRVKAALGSAMGRAPGRFQAAGANVSQGPRSVIAKQAEQVHLAMAFRIFGREDRRRYAAKLAGIMLGGNMSSRLFQTVREKHGLAYSVQTSTSLFHDTGAFSVDAGLDQSKFGRGVALIGKELRRFREKGPGAKELERARDYAIGQLRINMETTTSQMMWVGECLTSYGEYRSPESVINGLQAVDIDQIKTCSRWMLQPKRLSVSVVVPEGLKSADADIDRALAHL